MSGTITFIQNLGALIQPGGINYNNSLGLNLKNFGVDVNANWNEPDINYTATGLVDSNLDSLIDGTPTGIACNITNASPSSDISGDGTSSTSNFPAGIFQRGVRMGNGDDFALTFSGLPSNANVRCSVALFVTTTVYATENGVLQVTDGAGTASTGFNCTTPTEVQLETQADSSGNYVVTITANSGATNGVGMCGVKLEWES